MLPKLLASSYYSAQLFIKKNLFTISNFFTTISLYAFQNRIQKQTRKNFCSYHAE